MKQLLFLSLIIMSFFSNQAISQEAENAYTTYYLIRHAEKDTTNAQEKDPNLTEIGIQRANYWATLFSEIKLDEIYSTDYKRTLNTAKPIAESQNLEVKNYHPKEVYQTDFKTQTQGKVVLIVGHSNTIPVFANYLIGKDIYTEFSESIYNNLYTITLDRNEQVIKNMMTQTE